MKKVIAILIFLILVPFVQGAYAQNTGKQLKFDANQYIPLFSLGFSEKATPDEKNPFIQFLGVGCTFIDFKRVRTLGLEVNLLGKPYYIGNERGEYLGVGVVYPLINYELSRDNGDGVLTLRIASGYGFFSHKSPERLILVGIAISQ